MGTIESPLARSRHCIPIVLTELANLKSFLLAQHSLPPLPLSFISTEAFPALSSLLLGIFSYLLLFLF